jgi:hypothetical protein
VWVLGCEHSEVQTQGQGSNNGNRRFDVHKFPSCFFVVTKRDANPAFMANAAHPGHNKKELFIRRKGMDLPGGLDPQKEKRAERTILGGQ